MSERHARASHAGSPDVAARQAAGALAGAPWPFPAIENDAALQERLDTYRLQMQAAIEANEVLMRGIGCAAQKSIDVLQSVSDAARDDLARAMAEEEPEASVRAQMDAFHSRSRELLDGMRSVADDVYECWFNAMDRAWPAAKPSLPRPAPTLAHRKPHETAEPGVKARQRA